MVSLRGLLGRLTRRLVGFVYVMPLGRILTDPAVTVARERTRRVRHGDVTLTLAVPSGLCLFRAMTFSSKEPETLEWIDGLASGSVLWDVGANVGLYSCYAALCGCEVFAFEPSVFNLEMLARNVCLNGIEQAVTVVPLALTDETGRATLKMTSTEWGGAQSSFGVDYGFDGTDLDVAFEYRTVGMSIDDVISVLGYKRPDHLKIDVDGIDHLVLRGGQEVLTSVQSVLIEVDEQHNLQVEEVTMCLNEAGMTLVNKQHSKMFDGGPYASSYNQIWIR